MPLDPGTLLGPYEILAPLGAGGMGEVYKARDPRLDRVVAIKVSSAQFSERFTREARSIASLNHPHICTVHDVGPNYLVLEFLEGETLAQRIGRGPIPFGEAMKYALEMADALDAAHHKGITHRDIKPANVMIVKTGTKLLDFGLARIDQPAVAQSDETLTMAAMTQPGTILGTFQYMAPEQLEGKEADARSDIFSFGALLYEMLTGQRAFQGKSQVGLFAAILEHHPTPVSSAQPAVPTELDRFLAICLSKNPDERFQTARELMRELKWIAEKPATTPPSAAAYTPSPTKPSRWPYALAAIGLLAAAGLAALHFTEKPTQLPHLRFQVTPPENVRFAGTPPRIALSPDGTQIAFNATKDGKTEMWVRRLDSGGARPLPNSEGSETPFWSPDSKSVGLFTSGKLKRIDVANGTVQVLSDAPVTDAGGSWSPDGQTILFSGRNPEFTVHQITAAGGTATPVLKLLPQETLQRWPRFLPDGKHFFYFSSGKAPQDTGIALASLDGKERKFLTSSTSAVEYAAGYLFYRAEEALVARPFDLDKLEFTGEPVQVLPSVTAQANGRVSASISANGFLVANETDPGGGTEVLTWVDRLGKQLSTVGQPGSYAHLTLSPDGRQLALTSGNPGDIWGIDLARNVSSRLTFDPAPDSYPIWTHDGRALLFNSGRTNNGIYTKPSSGLGEEQLLFKSEAGLNQLLSVSSDGKWLLFTKGPAGSHDVYALPLLEKSEPIPVLTSRFEESLARFSPDGRWIAYLSNESGAPQIYIRSFPGSERKLQVSIMGGTQPRWRRDGKELFYLGADGAMMAVGIKSLAPLELGEVSTLFQSGLPVALGRSDYEVTADGSRFLLNRPVTAGSQATLTVIQNWQALLK
jgi:serine/threonine protein kinase